MATQHSELIEKHTARWLQNFPLAGLASPRLDRRVLQLNAFAKS
jgi:hypothetical protein